MENPLYASRFVCQNFSSAIESQDKCTTSDHEDLDSMDLYVARVMRRVTGPRAADIDIIWPAMLAIDRTWIGVDSVWSNRAVAIEAKSLMILVVGTEKVSVSESMIMPRNLMVVWGFQMDFVLLGTKPLLTRACLTIRLLYRAVVRSGETMMASSM